MREIIRALSLAIALIALKTVADLQSFPDHPSALIGSPRRELVVDRRGLRLSSSFDNEWNHFEQLRLEEVPDTLVRAFVTAEDRRFYEHAGVDWSARLSAILSAIRSGRLFRGASTITEQVVRILHERPRTFWSRWVETWEAYALERKWEKNTILEFYINQVPYASRRRGVLQASRLYFRRDFSTLNPAELLSLAVLVRSPSQLDPRKNPERLKKRVSQLAQALGSIPLGETTLASLGAQGSEAERNISLEVEVSAPQFIRFARERQKILNASYGSIAPATLATTLDSELQVFAQRVLDDQIQKLKAKQVRHGALLIADHQSGEILAWVTSGDTDYDTVRVPRQPGSAIKPFVYGLALEKGWTAATLINDEPLFTAVGRGIHPIRNYSRTHYGPVTLREALGNSLNIPAIKAVKFVTPEALLALLKRAGFSSLHQTADHYGEGLALGSAEVSLFELVQAYAMLAEQGRFRPLKGLRNEVVDLGEAVFEPEIATLLTNILSDPKARLLEFGRHSILNFQIPTAVKTGTATDFRDAWAVGYNSRFIAGVWMGHLDRLPTDGNTGAKAPALILRSVMSFLAKREDSFLNALPLSSSLVAREICRMDGRIILASTSREGCAPYTEYFLQGTEGNIQAPPPVEPSHPRIAHPVAGMEVAWDPRVPKHSQALELRLENEGEAQDIEWVVDGKRFARTRKGSVLWPVERGPHRIHARVFRGDGAPLATEEIKFKVK